MKLYQTAQKNLVYLGIGPYHPEKRHQFNKSIYMYILMCFLGLAQTGAFLVFEANTFDEYTEGMYILSASILSPMAVASQAIQLKTLFKLINQIEVTFESRMKFSASRELYEEVAQRAETCSRWISIVAIRVLPLYAVIALSLTIFFLYYVYDLSNDAFILAVPMWFPFDTKNPIGYSLAMLDESLMGLYAFSALISLATIAIDCFLYVTTMAKDMIRMLNDVKRNAKVKNDRPRILGQICEFIEFHSSVKQFSKDCTALYQPIFASMFLWSLVTITGSMLLIEMELKSHSETNSMEVICAFSFVSIACELGERFSGAFEDVSDLIDEFKWYRFPNEVQRILPYSLVHAQRPIALECFGSILCGREALKSVMNTAYSYFMARNWTKKTVELF